MEAPRAFARLTVNDRQQIVDPDDPDRRHDDAPPLVVALVGDRHWDGSRTQGIMRPTLLALPLVIRKRSALHGFGVFAAEPINKNTRIIDYAGELVRNDRSEAREGRYLADGCIWVFRINRTWSRDAAIGGNVARFINHSCSPNCWFEIVDRTIWIRASRRIRAGEELTYDYATVGERTIPCRCRPGCPNRL